MAQWNEQRALDGLTAAVEAKDGATAEALLADAWRRTRHPTHTALLLRVRDQLAGPKWDAARLKAAPWVAAVTPLVAATAQGSATPWQRVALHGLVAGVAELAPTLRPAQLVPYLQALEALKDDPAALVLCAAIVEPFVRALRRRTDHVGDAETKLLVRIVKLARRTKGPEASALLQRLADGLAGARPDVRGFSFAFMGLESSLEGAPPFEPKETLKLPWVALEKKVKALVLAPASPDRAARDVDSLFEVVYAEPREHSRRSVLPDALQERGEPRGEFITLQLAGPQGAQRAQALLEKHSRDWLAPFALCSPGASSSARGSFTRASSAR